MLIHVTMALKFLCRMLKSMSERMGLYKAISSAKREIRATKGDLMSYLINEDNEQKGAEHGALRHSRDNWKNRRFFTADDNTGKRGV